MLNISVGILGHVDSGKTSLAKALSTTASTAAFDKSPQSQARGITLDLGFSACEITASTPGCGGLLAAAGGIEGLQCALVDCPGHASLIRTVVGGAQIIDVMVLVIDAVKGVQAQTAECIVLGEVLARPLVVAINKVDAIQGNTEAEKSAALERLKKRLAATFARTRWPKVSMVEISAAPRDGSAPQGVEQIWPAALALLDLAALQRERLRDGSLRDFLMLVDHCFAVKGQGTVLTGTVLRGAARVGSAVLMPEIQETRKIKSLQVFRRPVEAIRHGDRAGVCVSQLDPSLLERGMICGAPEADGTAAACALTAASVFIARVHRVRFHTAPCDSQTKFHINVGHSTVMGTLRYFRRPAPPRESDEHQRAAFDTGVESECVEELGDDAILEFDAGSGTAAPGIPIPVKRHEWAYYAVVLLESAVYVSTNAVFVAMRLDQQKENFCRLAIVGAVERVLDGFAEDGKTPLWRTLPVTRYKERPLTLDRVVDAYTCVVSDVVVGGASSSSSSSTQPAGAAKQKDVLHAEVQKFVGLKVNFVPDPSENGDGAAPPSARETITGKIDSAFGKTGKAKVVFQKPVFNVSTASKGKGKEASSVTAVTESFLVPGQITLSLKKHPWALHSSLQQ